MSKELTPLEVSKQLKDFVLEFVKNSLDRRFIIGSFDIIETSLKEKENIENRLDEIFENHNIKSFTELNERLCDYNELKFDDDIKRKKLKALEITKNTRVDTNLIKFSKDYDDYCGLEVIKLLGEKEIPKQKGITEEEYELLKEVLL